MLQRKSFNEIKKIYIFNYNKYLRYKWFLPFTSNIRGITKNIPPVHFGYVANDNSCFSAKNKWGVPEDGRSGSKILSLILFWIIFSKEKAPKHFVNTSVILDATEDVALSPVE